MKILATVFSLLIAGNAFAALGDGTYSGMVQLMTSKPNADSDAGSVDEEYSATIGGGVRALWGLNDSGLSLRSGLFLRQKDAKFEAGSVDFTLEYLYLSVPLTLHYMFATDGGTKAGIFGGAGADLLIDDDCDVDGATSCDYDDGNDVVVPLIIGFDLMFTEKWGMEVSYEHGLTEVDDDVKLNTFGLAGYYTF